MSSSSSEEDRNESEEADIFGSSAAPSLVSSAMVVDTPSQSIADSPQAAERKAMRARMLMALKAKPDSDSDSDQSRRSHHQPSPAPAAPNTVVRKVPQQRPQGPTTPLAAAASSSSLPPLPSMPKLPIGRPPPSSDNSDSSKQTTPRQQPSAQPAAVEPRVTPKSPRGPPSLPESVLQQVKSSSQPSTPRGLGGLTFTNNTSQPSATPMPATGSGKVSPRGPPAVPAQVRSKSPSSPSLSRSNSALKIALPPPSMPPPSQPKSATIVKTTNLPASLPPTPSNRATTPRSSAPPTRALRPPPSRRSSDATETFLNTSQASTTNTEGPPRPPSKPPSRSNSAGPFPPKPPAVPRLRSDSLTTNPLDSNQSTAVAGGGAGSSMASPSDPRLLADDYVVVIRSGSKTADEIPFPVPSKETRPARSSSTNSGRHPVLVPSPRNRYREPSVTTAVGDDSPIMEDAVANAQRPASLSAPNRQPIDASTETEPTPTILRGNQEQVEDEDPLQVTSTPKAKEFAAMAEQATNAESPVRQYDDLRSFVSASTPTGGGLMRHLQDTLQLLEELSEGEASNPESDSEFEVVWEEVTDDEDGGLSPSYGGAFGADTPRIALSPVKGSAGNNGRTLGPIPLMAGMDNRRSTMQSQLSTLGVSESSVRPNTVGSPRTASPRTATTANAVAKYQGEVERPYGARRLSDMFRISEAAKATNAKKVGSKPSSRTASPLMGPTGTAFGETKPSLLPPTELIAAQSKHNKARREEHRAAVLEQLGKHAGLEEQAWLEAYKTKVEARRSAASLMKRRQQDGQLVAVAQQQQGATDLSLALPIDRAADDKLWAVRAKLAASVTKHGSAQSALALARRRLRELQSQQFSPSDESTGSKSHYKALTLAGGGQFDGTSSILPPAEAVLEAVANGALSHQKHMPAKLSAPPAQPGKRWLKTRVRREDAAQVAARYASAMLGDPRLALLSAGMTDENAQVGQNETSTPPQPTYRVDFAPEGCASARPTLRVVAEWQPLNTQPNQHLNLNDKVLSQQQQHFSFFSSAFPMPYLLEVHTDSQSALPSEHLLYLFPSSATASTTSKGTPAPVVAKAPPALVLPLNSQTIEKVSLCPKRPRQTICIDLRTSQHGEADTTLKITILSNPSIDGPDASASPLFLLLAAVTSAKKSPPSAERIAKRTLVHLPFPTIIPPHLTAPLSGRHMATPSASSSPLGLLADASVSSADAASLQAAAIIHWYRRLLNPTAHTATPLLHPVLTAGLRSELQAARDEGDRSFTAPTTGSKLKVLDPHGDGSAVLCPDVCGAVKLLSGNAPYGTHPSVNQCNYDVRCLDAGTVRLVCHPLLNQIEAGSQKQVREDGAEAEVGTSPADVLYLLKLPEGQSLQRLTKLLRREERGGALLAVGSPADTTEGIPDVEDDSSDVRSIADSEDKELRESESSGENNQKSLIDSEHRSSSEEIIDQDDGALVIDEPHTTSDVSSEEKSESTSNANSPSPRKKSVSTEASSQATAGGKKAPSSKSSKKASKDIFGMEGSAISPKGSVKALSRSPSRVSEGVLTVHSNGDALSVSGAAAPSAVESVAPTVASSKRHMFEMPDEDEMEEERAKRLRDEAERLRLEAEAAESERLRRERLKAEEERLAAEKARRRTKALAAAEEKRRRADAKRAKLEADRKRRELEKAERAKARAQRRLQRQLAKQAALQREKEKRRKARQERFQVRVAKHAYESNQRRQHRKREIDERRRAQLARRAERMDRRIETDRLRRELYEQRLRRQSFHRVFVRLVCGAYGASPDDASNSFLSPTPSASAASIATLNAASFALATNHIRQLTYAIPFLHTVHDVALLPTSSSDGSGTMLVAMEPCVSRLSSEGPSACTFGQFIKKYLTIPMPEAVSDHHRKLFSITRQLVGIVTAQLLTAIGMVHARGMLAAGLGPRRLMLSVSTDVKYSCSSHVDENIDGKDSAIVSPQTSIGAGGRAHQHHQPITMNLSLGIVPKLSIFGVGILSERMNYTIEEGRPSSRLTESPAMGHLRADVFGDNSTETAFSHNAATDAVLAAGLTMGSTTRRGAVYPTQTISSHSIGGGQWQRQQPGVGNYLSPKMASYLLPARAPIASVDDDWFACGLLLFDMLTAQTGQQVQQSSLLFTSPFANGGGRAFWQHEVIGTFSRLRLVAAKGGPKLLTNVGTSEAVASEGPGYSHVPLATSAFHYYLVKRLDAIVAAGIAVANPGSASTSVFANFATPDSLESLDQQERKYSATSPSNIEATGMLPLWLSCKRHSLRSTILRNLFTSQPAVALNDRLSATDDHLIHLLFVLLDPMPAKHLSAYDLLAHAAFCVKADGSSAFASSPSSRLTKGPSVPSSATLLEDLMKRALVAPVIAVAASVEGNDASLATMESAMDSLDSFTKDPSQMLGWYLAQGNSGTIPTTGALVLAAPQSAASTPSKATRQSTPLKGTPMKPTAARTASPMLHARTVTPSKGTPSRAEAGGGQTPRGRRGSAVSGAAMGDGQSVGFTSLLPPPLVLPVAHLLNGQRLEGLMAEHVVPAFAVTNNTSPDAEPEEANIGPTAAIDLVRLFNDAIKERRAAMGMVKAAPTEDDDLIHRAAYMRFTSKPSTRGDNVPAAAPAGYVSPLEGEDKAYLAQFNSMLADYRAREGFVLPVANRAVVSVQHISRHTKSTTAKVGWPAAAAETELAGTPLPSHQGDLGHYLRVAHKVEDTSTDADEIAKAQLRALSSYKAEARAEHAVPDLGKAKIVQPNSDGSRFLTTKERKALDRKQKAEEDERLAQHTLYVAKLHRETYANAHEGLRDASEDASHRSVKARYNDPEWNEQYASRRRTEGEYFRQRREREEALKTGSWNAALAVDKKHATEDAAINEAPTEIDTSFEAAGLFGRAPPLPPTHVPPFLMTAMEAEAAKVRESNVAKGRELTQDNLKQLAELQSQSLKDTDSTSTKKDAHALLPLKITTAYGVTVSTGIHEDKSSVERNKALYQPEDASLQQARESGWRGAAIPKPSVVGSIGVEAQQAASAAKSTNTSQSSGTTNSSSTTSSTSESTSDSSSTSDSTSTTSTSGSSANHAAGRPQPQAAGQWVPVSD